MAQNRDLGCALDFLEFYQGRGVYLQSWALLSDRTNFSYRREMGFLEFYQGGGVCLQSWTLLCDRTNFSYRREMGGRRQEARDGRQKAGGRRGRRGGCLMAPQISTWVTRLSDSGGNITKLKFAWGTMFFFSFFSFSSTPAHQPC